MKFYESSFEEYLAAADEYNIHEEVIYSQYMSSFLKSNDKKFENLIIYGPSGIGKYTQVLNILRPYSPSELKYEKKIVYKIDKQEFIYHISDIHYEIDMSLLGCNSKNTWYEIFSQIVDIISMKTNKIGIIVCKNFHMIHNELLEIFYSYIQQFNYTHIKIKFILITEHLSFIPNKILNVCHIINISRPNNEKYKKLLEKYAIKMKYTRKNTDIEYREENTYNILDDIKIDNILNIKELRSFALIKSCDDIPTDIFNTICDNIINEMENIEEFNYSKFRDTIYDILIYNLDASECLWYIICHFIMSDKLDSVSITSILNKTYSFLKYYNNNYRPIYHLESILFYIIIKIYGYNDDIRCQTNIKDIRVKYLLLFY
jgi:DNA polymerase III delta prime subunit